MNTPFELNRQKTRASKRSEEDRHLAGLGPQQEDDLLSDAERIEKRKYTEYE